MRDADQGAKQIKWLEIFANVAAPDCPLHQRIDRTLDSTAGTLFELPPTNVWKLLRRVSITGEKCFCREAHSTQ